MWNHYTRTVDVVQGNPLTKTVRGVRKSEIQSREPTAPEKETDGGDEREAEI